MCGVAVVGTISISKIWYLIFVFALVVIVFMEVVIGSIVFVQAVSSFFLPLVELLLVSSGRLPLRVAPNPSNSSSVILLVDDMSHNTLKVLFLPYEILM